MFCIKSAPNSPFFPRNSGLSSRARGTRGAGRACGADGLQRGQQGKVRRLPRHPAGVVYVGHIEEAIIGHQLARPVNAAQHPGRGHAPGVAGRQRRAGGLGRRGRLRGAGLRHRGWAGRRTLRRALGRAAARRCPGPPVGQFKVVALVTLHIASFLRRNGGTIS